MLGVEYAEKLARLTYEGDLHLRAALAETCPRLDDVAADIDGDARPIDAQPGADQP